MSTLCKKLLCSCPLSKRDEAYVQWKNFTCSYKKFKSAHFWAYLNEAKRSNFEYKSSNKLINEKSIDLNDEISLDQTVLYIGLKPENKFEICARLEDKNSSYYFMLNVNELKTLLKFCFETTNQEQTSIKSSARNSNISERFIIRVNDSDNVEIISNTTGRRILLKEAAINKLVHVNDYILCVIFFLEKYILHYENLYIKLLENFCIDKTIDAACDSTNNTSIRIFFTRYVSIKCGCTDENFTLEIATKFESWFGLCVRVYLKTLMLTESERLATFRLKWPHGWHYVSTEEMAKCGLYFTGTNDNVKCAFCNVKIHQWQFGDIPIKEHFKFSPKCPFLYDFRKTSNICDVGTIGEIDKLIKRLPKERGIDEVDDKQNVTNVE